MTQSSIPSEEEVLAVIRENPFISSREIAQKLRPDEYGDGTGKAYHDLMQGLRGILLPMFRDGKIASNKVQCCTFNLKKWVANREAGPPRFARREH